ncbi:MAG: tripartite tricarboxylate transporter substrate binding protein [Proteobacteria bacterium]|nr:tripartite tricarboxylate transporter substrate binding protein [Burkholderiales bacterium]
MRLDPFPICAQSSAARRHARALHAALLLLALPFPVACAQAQAYPDRPIRMVVPFAAGGSSDVIGRIVGARLTDALRQPVLIDTRPGAGTSIGNAVVARANPDGYTLLLADTAFAASSSVLQNLPYDALKDFSPVSLLGTSAQYLYAAPGRHRNAQALLAAARAKPGQLTIASGGTGTTTHFMVELLKRAAAIDVVHVPYKGSAPALADAAGGQVEAVFASFASAAALVTANRLQVLAIAAARRHPTQPDAPTLTEIGAKDLVADHWWGVIAPARTPRDVVQRMNTELARAIATPEAKERFPALAVDARASTPGEFAQLIETDVRRFGRIAREANIKVD